MIDKNLVSTLAEQWLEGKDYFLTDVRVGEDNKILVEIDNQAGVWIDDCVDLSKHIEAGLDRDEEDFELEVGSAGIGQPFRVYKQYEINEGKEVEVLAKSGKKYQGTLSEVKPEGFGLISFQKVKLEGKKRPVIQEVLLSFSFDEVKATKRIISFK